MKTSKWLRWFSAAAIGFLCGSSVVQADVIIIGGLGNFDTPNKNDDDCNEFDIELEGPHCDDVYHTYRNPNYGSPTIEPLPGYVGIRVIYRNPQHATPGAIATAVRVAVGLPSKANSAFRTALSRDPASG